MSTMGWTVQQALDLVVELIGLGKIILGITSGDVVPLIKALGRS